MLYIHIPYCRHKCIYCDFFSGGERVADWGRLRRALVAELRERVAEPAGWLPSQRLPSLYLGGGTPSLMPVDELECLMEDVMAVLAGAGIMPAPDCEVTLEANPEDVTAANVKAWKRMGINRVSLGIQTFSDSLLRRIGRSHSGADAERAMYLLREEFGNVSGDLIFGLPGQSLGMFGEDVIRILSMRPEHISVYTLMYEEGTALTALRDSGRLEETDEETVTRQYRLLTDCLADAGYEHYEISNYALPGHRSRHNSGYWLRRPYLGIGPSAHSYDGRARRRANPPDLFGYLRRFAPGVLDKTSASIATSVEVELPPFYKEEILTLDELCEESIMLGLRRREGIDLDAFRKEFGERRLSRLLRSAEPHLTAALLHHAADRLALTSAGILLSDTVILALI